MTLILVVLILASLASMAWAFLASTKFEDAAKTLEARVKTRLDLPPQSAMESDKGAPK
jgi:hypothetical protein